jgi:hypothetical protein
MKYKSTEQTISWFCDRFREANLVLDPPFQRRPVWSRRQQGYLVESVLLDLPIPELFIQQRTTAAGETTHVVVDGQQRIRAILEFVGVAGDGGFSLEHIDPRSPWHGIAFDDMPDGDKERFYGYALGVRLLSETSVDEVRSVFRRFNEFLTKLTAQELRNATYKGPFMTLANDLADNDYWSENRIVTPQSIRRMADVEYVSELLVGVMHGPQAKRSVVLDDFYLRYEDYDDEFPGQADVERLFAATFDEIQRLYPNIKATRWQNKTDFYSLFVATAHLLRDHAVKGGQRPKLLRVLNAFAKQVSERLADESARVPRNVTRYVAAVEKGSSDKARRTVRHRVLVNLMLPHFSKSKK